MAARIANLQTHVTAKQCNVFERLWGSKNKMENGQCNEKVVINLSSKVVDKQMASVLVKA